MFWGNKTLSQLILSCFFCFFGKENVEKEDFNQHLECAAPKRWSKYTTSEFLEQLCYHKEEEFSQEENNKIYLFLFYDH